MDDEESRVSVAAYSMQSTASSYKSSFKLNEDEYIDTYITIPPDGGWGWIVVFASFLCNFVADGALYTFGIFLGDISKTYKSKASTIALGNSLMTGFYYMSGPITCALVNRWGFQITGGLGGLVAAAAFFFSPMTNSDFAFVCVFGIVGGFGFGLVYVPSIVAVGFYFERWRALATSIAVTGSAAGIVGFPLIVEGALGKYTWQTKFKVISGFCIVTTCLALLYRPLKPKRVWTTKDKKVVQFTSGDVADSIGSFHLEEKPPGFLKRIINRFHNITYPTHAQLHKESTFVINFPIGPSTSSVFITSVPEGSMTTFMRTNASRSEMRSERLDKLSTVYEDESDTKKSCKKCCKKCCGLRRNGAFNRPMYRDDIFYTGSLYTLPPQVSQVSKINRMPQMKSLDYTLSVTRAEVLKEGTEERLHWKCCPESVIRTLVTMLNFDLLKSPSFVCLVCSGFFTLLGMFVPFIYLIQRADENNISRDVSYHLFTALGISNALGRIISGIISSLPKAKPLIVSCISLFICGLSTFVSYFLRDVYSQFIYVSIFGLTIACLASLRTPIVVELLGLENLTNAFGLLLLIHGIAGFLGMPIAGRIVKLANSYNSAFLFSGSTLMLSAGLLIPVKRISEWEQNKRKI
ncbi:monocarboxylate transporter 8-like [Tribolium madens]|uniref:monocarboxylate transporter 8-like n=1 Tax=Tribolium madens TaxID=41895 RepID=UPI001CF76123|nr:monocarboxylate transporter 8-like [Tribolium madens]